MYALIEFAGKQYKVEENRSIQVPHVQGKVGTKVPLDKILYLEDGDKKIIGSPFVVGKKLDGEIVSHSRGRKVVIFKFKRRKGYQKKNTHRQEYTILKVGKLETKKITATTKKTTTSSTKKTVAIKKDVSKTANKKPTRKKVPVTKSSEKKK